MSAPLPPQTPSPPPARLIGRRRFLALGAGLLGAGLLGCTPRAPEPGSDAQRAWAARSPRIGVALGGGGARGLAHIPVLEVFDELGLRPHRITGTSIGAVIGALYASGCRASELRSLVDRLVVNADEKWTEALLEQDVLAWWSFLDLDPGEGGLISADNLVAYLRREAGTERFDELGIPLRVVATDFWERVPVVIDSGELWPAVRASMALPGLFPPVQHRGRTLVDGGLVNPVPYDLLRDECDLTVAVDVLGERTPAHDGAPGYLETLFNSVQIMQAALVRQQMEHRAPDIYLAPEITDVRVLEFFKADQILRQSEAAKTRLRAELEARLG